MGSWRSVTVQQQTVRRDPASSRRFAGRCPELNPDVLFFFFDMEYVIAILVVGLLRPNETEASYRLLPAEKRTRRRPDHNAPPSSKCNNMALGAWSGRTDELNAGNGERAAW
jgi:hypothetical protein